MSRNSDNNVSRNGDISESSSMLANDAEKQDPDDYIIVSEETNLNDQFESDSSNSNITNVRKTSIPVETRSLDERCCAKKDDIFFHKSSQDVRFSNTNHTPGMAKLLIHSDAARSKLNAKRDDDLATQDGPTKSNTCENCGHELVNPKTSPNSVDSPRSDCSLFSIYNQQSSCEFCRICHCGGDTNDPLIAPCKCKGSMTHVHHSCLQRWIKSSGYRHCELCGYQFVMNSKLKPIYKWQKLAMTKTERRKICCSVIFHIIAITCVVWSLYVLIEKTAMELQTGSLHWPFWTKLAVVAVGLTGGLAFMYVQCKTYYILWKRLMAFNQIIRVEDRPSVPSSALENEAENPQRNDVIEATVIPITSDNRTDTDVVIL